MDNKTVLKTIDKTHDHNVRNKKDMQIDMYKANKWSKGPMVMGCRFYNKLPKSIKDKSGVFFKNSLKEFLLLKCFYSIDEYFKYDLRNM
jgi:hypothetical protein